MTERTPWWKVFLPKKKSGTAKDSTNVFDPDFDPFAQRPKQKNPTDTGSKNPGDQSLSQHDSNHSQNDDDTYDDSQLESVFNEKAFRRSMKVSRSGRFRVKGKQRTALPINERDIENAAPVKEDIRRQ